MDTITIETHGDDIEATATHYACCGSVRGRCSHNHRTLSGALRCMARDQSGCASQGGYSDRDVQAFDSQDNAIATWIQEGYEADEGRWIA